MVTPQVMREFALEPLISLVDDEEVVRRGMSHLIEALGYRTASFATAEEFLTSTARQGTSVLISDVQLPGMSGPDLQEALMAEGYCFPIIFMTGFPNEQVRMRTSEAGALGFLPKPCKEESLIKLLEKALAPQV